MPGMACSRAGGGRAGLRGEPVREEDATVRHGGSGVAFAALCLPDDFGTGGGEGFAETGFRPVAIAGGAHPLRPVGGTGGEEGEEKGGCQGTQSGEHGDGEDGKELEQW